MSEKKDLDPKTLGEDMRLEDAMRRLDEVVAALDRENTDLEEALKLYEEGVRLVSVCNRKLADARRTIEILKVTPEGEMIQVPFEQEPNTTKE